jgi:hypothetical protein
MNMNDINIIVETHNKASCLRDSDNSCDKEVVKVLSRCEKHKVLIDYKGDNLDRELYKACDEYRECEKVNGPFIDTCDEGLNAIFCDDRGICKCQGEKIKSLVH